MSTPPDAPPGAMSIGDLNKAVQGGALPGPPRAYSPNPDAPIPPGYVRGEYTADGGPRKPAAPEGAMSAEQMNELLRPKSAAPAGPQKGPGLAHTFLEGLNQVVAETLGIPGSVAAHIIAPKIWNEATEEQREKLRKENPRESAIMDYLSRSAKQTEEVVGQTGVKNLFDKINVTGKGNEPVTPGEQATFAGGRMAGSVAVPGVGADAALASTWKEGAVMADGLSTITKKIMTRSLDSTSLGPIADIAGAGAAKSNFIGGAAVGAGGEKARQNAPENLKDVAETGAGFAAGGIAGIGTSFMEKLFSSVGANLSRIIEPANIRAARTLRDRGGSTVGEDVNRAATTPPLVDGSHPSLYQASGNPRVGMLEGDARRTEYGKVGFAEQEEANNIARMAELHSLRDPNTREGAVTSYLRSRLDQITDEQAARVQDAMEQPRTAHEAAGGSAGDNPSEYADGTRTILARLNDEAKQRERRLWDAVSEDRDTRVSTDTLQSTNRKMAFNIGRYAKQPEGEEADIRDIIKNLGKTVSFGDLTDIRSRITTRLMDMRAGANPNRQEFARLSQTLRSIDDTLLNSVKMNARKEGPRSAIIDKLEAAARAEDAQRAAVEGTDVGATRVAANEGGREPGPGPGETAPVGRVPEGEVPPAAGEGSAGGTGHRAAEGDQGIQREPPVESRDNLQVIGPAANDVLPLGQTTNEKYGAARGATAERKGTFERGIIGGVLRPGATPDTFRMLAGNVMRAVFDSPERLAATIKAGTKDGKLDPDLETNLKDYAAFSLKKAAGKEAGLLSPAKFQKWVDDHGYVLDQFPDLRAKFADMKTAQGSLDQAVADQKAALADFQSRAVKRLVHDGEEPQDIVAKTIGKPEFGEVTRQVAHDPDAAAGWKRAVAEHVADLATSVKEAGGSGEKQLAGDRLEKFLRDNASDLGTVFDKDELDSMNRVAADFRQGQRKMTGSQDKQPGTFLRVLSSVWTGRAVGAALGAEAGMHGGHLSAGALVGVLAAEGVQRVASGRAAAAKDALTDMLLDPKKANLWLEKIPPGTDWKDWAGPLSRRLGALYSGEMEKEIKEHGDQQ